MEIKLTFKGQVVLCPIAEKFNELSLIESRKSLFSNNQINNYGNNRISGVLKDIISAVSTFWTLIPEQICKIYFKKEVSESTQDILNIISDNTFKEGTKEREMAKELVKQYKLYEIESESYMVFDEDNFPLFRTSPKQEESKK